MIACQGSESKCVSRWQETNVIGQYPRKIPLKYVPSWIWINRINQSSSIYHIVCMCHSKKTVSCGCVEYCTISFFFLVYIIFFQIVRVLFHLLKKTCQKTLNYEISNITRWRKIVSQESSNRKKLRLNWYIESFSYSLTRRTFFMI